MDPRSPRPARPSRTTRRGAPRRAPVRVLSALAATAAAVVTLAACSGGDAREQSASPAPFAAPTALEAPQTVDPGPAPQVRLLDAGDARRRVMAYAPSREPVVIAVTGSGTARTVVPGARPRVQDTPEQVLTVEGRSEPDVDGAHRASVTVRDFTSVDELRAAQFATATGFTITWTRGADGAVSRLALEAPAEATDAARAAVEVAADRISTQMVVWPREPIGVGARWEVTREVTDAVAPRRTTTYELTAVEGDVATVRTALSAPETAPTLTAPSPDGGAGVTLDVTGYRVSGGGDLTVDLRAPLPVAGRTESSTRAVYTDPATGGRTTYDEDSVLTFRRD